MLSRLYSGADKNSAKRVGVMIDKVASVSLQAQKTVKVVHEFRG